MTAINILHLTDLHLGQTRLKGLLPTLRAELEADIAHLVSRAGPIDLVALTGDLVNTGSKSEYSDLEAFLVACLASIETVQGAVPLALVVPGNHDLTRQPGHTTAKILLSNAWSSASEEELLTAADGTVWSFVEASFANFEHWVKTTAVPMLTKSSSGIYPGDFSASFTKDDFTVGFVGLNSTYRHFSDAASPGTVGVSPWQINEAAGGDLASWSNGTDVAVLLTHHPAQWFAEADEVTTVLHHPSCRLRLHLSGHLHNEVTEVREPLTNGQFLRLSGRSLCGIETTTNALGATEDRLFGFALITLTKATEQVSLAVWPRLAPATFSGNWSFAPDANKLSKGSERSQALVLVPNGAQHPSQAPSSAPTTAGAISAASSPSPITRMATAGPAEIRQALADGSSVAIIGDRFMESPSGAPELAIAECESSISALLGLATGPSRSALPALLRIARQVGAEGAQELGGRYLGNPSSSDLHTISRLYAAPFRDVFYLSPCSDFSGNLEKPPFDVAFLDTPDSHFHLPRPEVPLRVRMSSMMPPRGSLDVYVPLSDDDRTPSADRHAWVGFAQNRISRSPCFFIADSPDASTVSAWVQGRGTGPGAGGFSVLVCPELSDYTQSLLALYGVAWHQSTVQQFVDQFLSPSHDWVSRGLVQLRASTASPTHSYDLEIVLRTNDTRGHRDYLLGRSPRWGDVADGFSAELTATRRIKTLIEQATSGPPRLVILEGTAGSGKTTILMQVALWLRRQGKRVAWFDAQTGARPERLVGHARSMQPSVTIIDDVDIYGARATGLLDQLVADARESDRVILASIRTVRLELLDELPPALRARHERITEDDGKELVRLLRTKHGVANQHWSDSQVEDILLKDSEGQLLVGMIHVTTGLSFKEKVASECAQLSSEDLFLYGCVALLSAELESITVDQLQSAADIDSAVSWRSIRRLGRAGLILPVDSDFRFRARHRVVAEQVRQYLKTLGKLQPVVEGCLWAFAASAGEGRELTTERRSLIRLLNHSYLISLGIGVEAVRGIYDRVEQLLAGDYHYWLQRGSFEAEQGDDKLALHALTMARTTTQGETDFKVRTEYAYLRLKSIAQLSHSEGALIGREAFEDLLGVMRERGTASPHTYVIVAKFGVPWLSDANLLMGEKHRLASEALRLLRLATRLDDTNRAVASVRQEAVDKLNHLVEATEARSGS